MKSCARYPGVEWTRRITRSLPIPLVLALYAGVLLGPASASPRMRLASPDEARTILLCMKDILLAENQRHYDWISVSFPKEAPRDLLSVLDNEGDVTVRTSDFEQRKGAFVPAEPSSLPCQPRTSTEFETWISAPYVDPGNMKENVTPESKYRFSNCIESWPVRRGSVIAVATMCVGETHLPEKEEDGHPCGGNFLGESSVRSALFRRTGKLWTYQGDIENANVAWANKNVRCKAPPIP